jgi:hypothetical protein
LSVLFAILPVADVFTLIGKGKGTLSVICAILPFTIVFAAIGISVFAAAGSKTEVPHLLHVGYAT